MRAPYLISALKHDPHTLPFVVSVGRAYMCRRAVLFRAGRLPHQRQRSGTIVQHMQHLEQFKQHTAKRLQPRQQQRHKQSSPPLRAAPVFAVAPAPTVKERAIAERYCVAAQAKVTSVPKERVDERRRCKAVMKGSLPAIESHDRITGKHARWQRDTTGVTTHP